MSIEPHSLRVRPLRQDDDAGAFRCGHPELDRWLAEFAWASQRRRTAATQVLVPAPGTGADATVLGYYSLASTAIVTDDLPRRLGRGQPAVLPAFLLARLAIDRSLRGQGVGGALLAHAVATADRAGGLVAARLLVVDAIDDAAAAFYTRHGFTALAQDRGRTRLVAVISRPARR